MSMTRTGQEPSDSATPRRREVVVIGGGQTGLAIGYLLAQQVVPSRSSKPPQSPRRPGASAGTR
jgi:glycine/D-amino acid oxidase-like deaminating enzyme